MTEPTDAYRALGRRLFGGASTIVDAPAPDRTTGPVVPAEGTTTPPPVIDPDVELRLFVRELFARADD